MRKSLARILVSIPFVVALVLIVPYVRQTAYLPQNGKAFSGPNWYLPYPNVHDSLLKANFHAHSRSWGGWTWGEDSAEEVIKAYVERGYTVPSLSNYERITPESEFKPPAVYVPVYEHGYNTRKVHFLCIGARSVSNWDYPLHFSLNHSRETIWRLRSHCDLIALAHPGARGAHVAEEMPELYGLDLMEVVNTMGARTEFWDATLSDGNAVWLLANDDMHDLTGPETFMRWNMIYTQSPSTDGILSSLRMGNHYGVLRYSGTCEDNRLTHFTITNDTLVIALRDTFNRLDLMGQNGQQVHSVVRDTIAIYPLKAEDTYVRAEVHQDHCVMYLNPVIRYNQALPYGVKKALVVDSVWTWLGKGMILCIIAGLLALWLRILKPQTTRK
jgi:hypothetical protein